MPTSIHPFAITAARRLRHDMTDGEKKLWAELRRFRGWYGIHVRRQAPVGRYVADFLIHAHKLIVEVDGEHHFTAAGQARDRQRDDWFADEGFRERRFNTGELEEQFDGCVEETLHALGLMTQDRGDPGSTLSVPGRAGAATASRSA